MEKGQQERVLLSKRHFLELVLNNTRPFPFWDLTFHGANAATQQKMPVWARDGIQLPHSKDAHPGPLHTWLLFSQTAPFPRKLITQNRNASQHSQSRMANETKGMFSTMFTSLGFLRYHEQEKHRHALRNLSFLTKPCAARLLPALN